MDNDAVKDNLPASATNPLHGDQGVQLQCVQAALPLQSCGRGRGRGQQVSSVIRRAQAFSTFTLQAVWTSVQTGQLFHVQKIEIVNKLNKLVNVFRTFLKISNLVYCLRTFDIECSYEMDQNFPQIQKRKSNEKTQCSSKFSY